MGILHSFVKWLEHPRFSYEVWAMKRSMASYQREVDAGTASDEEVSKAINDLYRKGYRYEFIKLVIAQAGKEFDGGDEVSSSLKLRSPE